jgi:pimeloyl-ACP methyl ester carboxylesterase
MDVRGGTIEGPDGTQVSYEIVGAGPALILTNGLTTTSTFWKYLKPRWTQRYSVLTWDYPGHGVSAPARTPWAASVEAQPVFLERVMNAAGVDKGVHMGFSMGSQVVLEMYRQLPERCTALVSLLGGAGNVLPTTQFLLGGKALSRLMRFSPDPLFKLAYPLFAHGTGWAGGWAAGKALGLLGQKTSNADLKEVTDHLLTVDAVTLRHMAVSAEQHSLFDWLKEIRVPLLIVSGDSDPFAPAELTGERMRRAVPGSELVRLPGITHTGMLEEAQHIADVIEPFLARVLGAMCAAS